MPLPQSTDPFHAHRFLGPPGSGKGTQAQRLQGLLHVAHLSTGEALRRAVAANTALGREADRFMKLGHLVPDDVVFGVVAERIGDKDCMAGCLFDGFPRTVPQAEAFDRLLTERRTPLDLVLALDATEPVLTERLLSRGRPDDKPDTIRERFRQYAEQTEPLLDYYRERGILRQIGAEGTPDEVFERIRAALGRVPN